MKKPSENFHIKASLNTCNHKTLNLCCGDSQPEREEIDPRGIMRTISSMISELGTFTTALILQDTICRLASEDEAGRFAEILGDYFPLYGEIIATGISPADIENIIKTRTGTLVDQIRRFTSIVFVGIESIILDTLCTGLPDSEIYIVPHTENINQERILANFPSNVHLIDTRSLMDLGGVRSILISCMFCPMGEEAFIYPVTFRAVGPDTKSAYNQIIGLNILSGYNRYLAEMAPLYAAERFFTSQFRII